MQNENLIESAIQTALGQAPDRVIFDGKFHRFPTKSAPCWYIAHSPDAVTFGDWRTASKQTWFAGSAAEKLPDSARIALDEQRAARIARDEQRAGVAATVAAAIWAVAPPAPADHPYLARKQIAPHFARILTPEAVTVAPAWIARFIADNDLVGALIIPAGNAGKLTTLQFIRPSGDKRNLPSGKRIGPRSVLGRLTDAEIIIIVEGFATGASVHEATGFPVVVAGDKGNLATVAVGIRRDHPTARIIIAGDNDIRPVGSTLNNDGVVKAKDAALRVSATVVIPQLDGKKCDWNDVAVALGRDEVNWQIQRALLEISPAAVAAGELRSALRRFLDRVGTPEQQDLAIRAAAGLGKSTQTLEEIHERRLTADYFVPSHKLAAEQVARLPAGAAIAIRGRTQGDAENKPLCAKHEAATALEKAGLGSLSAPLLCGKIDPATGKRPCPHAASCGYLKQFSDTAPIRFYAHEWMPLPERSNRTAQVAVIDESFRDALERHKSWPVADLFAAGSIYRTLAAAVADGNLIEVASANFAAIDAAIDAAPERIYPAIHPEMSADEALLKLANWDDSNASERRCIGFIRDVKRAVEANAPLSIWHVARGKDAGKIYAARTAAIEFIPAGTPRLFIDASLSPRLVRAVSPSCELVDIAAKRNAHLVQVSDTALAKWRLDADNDHLSSRILELVTRKVSESPNGAIIAAKGWLEAHGSRLPVCVKQAHFGALRGLNALEGCDWLIVVGRNEPPTWSVEATARAWFASDPEFLAGTATREKTALVARNGDSAMITRTGFADPRCQEILESIREQETLQAIDRLRLVHADKPKTIYLLSNLPLPGLPPDELVALDDLLLPGRLAEVMLRDFVITGPAMLAARHPDLFKTTDAAMRELRTFGAGLNVSFANKNPIWETTHLTEVTYRTAGTAGKPRRAMLRSGLPAATVAMLLEEIHGKPVTILSLKPPISSLQATPAALTEIEEPRTLPEPPPTVWIPPDEDWIPIAPIPEPWEYPQVVPDKPLYLPNSERKVTGSAMPAHLADLYAGLREAREKCGSAA